MPGPSLAWPDDRMAIGKRNTQRAGAWLSLAIGRLASWQLAGLAEPGSISMAGVTAIPAVVLDPMQRYARCGRVEP